MPHNQLLQIPGPTNVPDRVLSALARPTIDHRSAEFRALLTDVLEGLAAVFRTADPLVIYPASASGAWEAALVNTLSGGDRVLAFDVGHFAMSWASRARDLGLDVTVAGGDWRCGVDPEMVRKHLSADRSGTIRAVLLVHNETSTGVTSDVHAVRTVIDQVGHPALLLVDVVSSLGSMEYRHTAWKADVAIAGSQKGLLLPPGLAFNALSEPALRANGSARLPRSYWAWDDILRANEQGVFPYTPATNLLFGLSEALELIRAEGLNAVFARHARHARAVRKAILAWGFCLVGRDPSALSNSVSAFFLPPDVDDQLLRRVLDERCGVVVGGGLGKFGGRVIRLGHLGHLTDAMVLGMIGAVEVALATIGAVTEGSGTQAAIEVLAESDH